jgi:hypothetical protein
MNPGANQSVLFTAESNAATCRDFLTLTADPAISKRQAALILGKSPSFFSGHNSFLERYKLGGVDALMPPPRGKVKNRALDLPAWFIPAARFFYLCSNLRRNGGSVPEAVRRTIELPKLPYGWNDELKKRFLLAIGCADLPACPESLRDNIQARVKLILPLVPKSIARQITINPVMVQKFRSPREFALDNLCAPGSQRRYFNGDAGKREVMAPGDWFSADDSTPGIAVCVPCSGNDVASPCTDKFGVLLGRWQFIVWIDCRTDRILAWSYVIRPRGSYRAEDILGSMRTLTMTHGIARRGYQLEGGIFNARLIRQAIELLRVEHWRTYSPHQKAIESVFNRAWTRLAIQFPFADLGRRRGENESNCKLYQSCKLGHKDPRQFFPDLASVLKVFAEEVTAHNARQIVSENYGVWVPDTMFDAAIAKNPLRQFSPSMDWIFSPFSIERKVIGSMVKCRVPMFESWSVPFYFSAPWMPMHNRRRVRIHFDPHSPNCRAKVILLEPSGSCNAGTILGYAEQTGETAAWIRSVMDLANDDPRAGYVMRQKMNGFVSRHVRAVGDFSRVQFSTDERRDGLGSLVKVERPAPVPEMPAEEIPALPASVPDIADLCRAGNGKIARLPKQLRDEILQRLKGGQTAKIIIAWLSGLVEVTAILEAQFSGKPISEINLFNWKQSILRAAPAPASQPLRPAPANPQLWGKSPIHRA